MSANDFETKLDEALSQLAEDGSPEQLGVYSSETGELLQVARRLRVLAPAPMPNLAKGRHAFMVQAARLGAQPASASRWSRQLHPRRPLVLAGSAVLVLIVGVMVALTASSFVAGIQAVPTWWSSSTPTMHPTYTATPTQISMAPVEFGEFRSSWVPQIESRSSLPSPNPAPQAEVSRQASK